MRDQDEDEQSLKMRVSEKREKKKEKKKKITTCYRRTLQPFQMMLYHVYFPFPHFLRLVGLFLMDQRCTTCNGVGLLTCPQCHGAGQCTVLGMNKTGEGFMAIRMPKCEQVQCTICPSYTKGRIVCYKCNGAGVRIAKAQEARAVVYDSPEPVRESIVDRLNRERNERIEDRRLDKEIEKEKRKQEGREQLDARRERSYLPHTPGNPYDPLFTFFPEYAEWERKHGNPYDRRTERDYYDLWENKYGK